MRFTLTLLLAIAPVFLWAQHKTEGLLQNAFADLNEGNYAQAEKKFTQLISLAIKDTPVLKAAYIYRAFTQNGMGNYNLAIRDFDNALQLDGEDIQTYMDRGKTYFQMKNDSAALLDFLSVIRRDDRSPVAEDAYSYLGLIYYYSGEYEESVNHFTAQISLNPKNAKAFFNRANAYNKMNKTRETLQDLDSAILLDPDFISAYTNRAITRLNDLNVKQEAMTPEEIDKICKDLEFASDRGDPHAKTYQKQFCK